MYSRSLKAHAQNFQCHFCHTLFAKASLKASQIQCMEKTIPALDDSSARFIQHNSMDTREVIGNSYDHLQFTKPCLDHVSAPWVGESWSISYSS